jgi:dolichol-phosphate mannosyltransferase
MTMLSLNFSEIPRHEIREFSPRKTRYCFCPVVYNEGDRFRRQLHEMSKNASLADILVAERRGNDGSTAPDFLQANGVRALLTTDEAGGATAIRMVFDYALREGYEGIVLIDGNGKDGVEALPRLLEQLEAGMDFVQASRFVCGGVHKNTPLLREIGIKFIVTPLLWLGGGFWYTDSTNGFRGYSRRFLEHPRVEPLRACFTRFNLQFYLSLMAPKLGLKLVEIPATRIYPDDGSTPTKVIGFKQNFLVLWEIVLTVCGKYAPPKHGVANAQ